MSNFYNYIDTFLFDFFYGLVKYCPWGMGRFLRFCILKIWLKKINSFYILEGVTVICPRDIWIGENTTINEWVHLNGKGQIEIGDWVDIAHSVSIESADHGFSSLKDHIRFQEFTVGKIIIEDDVWIGCGTRILKGVRIGKGSTIGAGSVVTKDIPPYSIAVGNPCVVIKNRKEIKDSQV